jgi:hypothetical protein
MQDRLPPDRRKPLATRGRTIHWVKLRRTQCEQMSSGLPLNADIPRYSRNVSNVPIAEVGLLDHLVSMGEKRGLRDQLRRKPWPRRSTSRTSITGVAGAILVNAPTLGGWYLLQGQAVPISRTTGFYALLFSGPSRREGESGEIGVGRIECSRTR